LLLRILSVVSFCLWTVTSVAGVDPSIQAAIEAGLKRGSAGIQVTKVAETPMKDVYYVKVAGGPILYTNADGSYFIQGDLVEVQSGRFSSWAEKTFVGDRIELVKSIDPKSTINFSPDGERKAVMYVFTDADCGYCRKLHAEISQLNEFGIEVRYLAYPRAGIGSSAYKKMVSAWCADDPNKAMTQIKSGQRIPEIMCEGHPVNEHMEIVQELGLSGTPAVLFMDGTIIPGYRPAADFAKILGVQ